MARFTFDGVPTVAPTGPPSDEQRISASPEMFGGLTARAEQTLGQGVEHVADAGFDVLKFQHKVNADYETNNYIAEQNKLLYGDPSKTTQGPDGKPVPDLGYYGLTGRDASDRRADTLKALDDVRQRGRNNLPSADAQLEYDTQTKRMYADAYAHTGAHAEQQWKSWAGDVNQTRANLALDSFVNRGFAKEDAETYIDYRVKQAQAKYGNDPDITNGVVESAKRDLLKAHTDRVAVNDPAAAIKLLNDHKDIAGTQYDDMYGKLRARANQQTGNEVAAESIMKSRGGTFAPTTSASIQGVAARYGISPNDLGRTVQIESGGNPRAQTGSYKGLLQLSQSEFDKYKPRPDANIWNPQDNLEAGAAKMKAESAQFAANFGRQPSGFDSYMIHQQGLAGYSAHLANPNAPAWQNMLATGEGRQKGDAWARAAIWGNIPKQYRAGFGSVDNVTSRDFINMWAAKYGGGAAPSSGPQQAANENQPQAQPAASFQAQPAFGESRGNVEAAAFPVPNMTAAIKPNVFQHILDDPRAQDPQVRAHALEVARQQLAAEEIAENQNAKVKRDAVEHVMGGYVTEFNDMIHSPNPDYVALAGRVNHDPALADEPEKKQAMMDRIRRVSGEEQALAFGPGYLTAREGLFSSPEAPGHIGDFSSLVTRSDITTAGLADLQHRWSIAKGSVDKQANEKVVNSFLQYAKKKLSFEVDEPYYKLRDPKGEAIFSSEFVPKFVQRVSELTDDAEKTGNHEKLDKFLSRENVDKMLTTFRNPQQMAADKMAATGAPQAPEPAGTPLPPPPEGLEAGGWHDVVAKPPLPGMNHAQWGGALQTLVNNPTPPVIEKFDQHFKAAGFDAKETLRKLGVNPEALAAIEKAEGQTKPGQEQRFPAEYHGGEQRFPPNRPAEAPKPGALSQEGQGPARAVGDWIREHLPHTGNKPAPAAIPSRHPELSE